MSRVKRGCDLSRQAQESLQGRQGFFPAAARTPSAPPRPRSRRPANMPSAIASARSARFARSGSSALNAAVRPFGMTYSVFINGLSKSGITVDRKVLSDLAIHEPAAFQAIAEKAKAALAA